jgi:hypothetical protein
MADKLKEIASPNILDQYKNFNFVQRIFDPFAPKIINSDNSVSTHKMATEVDANGDWYSFPTIVQRSDGQLHVFDDPFDAMEYGKATGEIIPFGKDKDAALSFGAGGYKKGTPLND